MPDIKRVLSYLPRKRQNLLFSATMPADIRKLAEKILHEPKTVQVANTKPVGRISQEFYPIHKGLKDSLLEAMLSKAEHDSVLIFTRTKHKAKNLARKLANRGHSATFLQGNMSQNQRVRALDGFKCGDFKIMVATDIAARGIDCERISHVINFDAPDTAETYTHRIGRTGRAGRTGKAISLVTSDDRALIRQIERIAKIKIENCTLEDFDYDQPVRRPVMPANNRRRPQTANSRFRGKNGNSRNKSSRSGKPSRRSGKAQASR